MGSAILAGPCYSVVSKSYRSSKVVKEVWGLGANSEIIKARKEMKIEFGLWLAVSIFQAIAILIWLLRNRAIQQALGADSP